MILGGSVLYGLLWFVTAMVVTWVQSDQHYWWGFVWIIITLMFSLPFWLWAYLPSLVINVVTAKIFKRRRVRKWVVLPTFLAIGLVTGGVGALVGSSVVMAVQPASISFKAIDPREFWLNGPPVFFACIVASCGMGWLVVSRLGEILESVET